MMLQKFKHEWLTITLAVGGLSIILLVDQLAAWLAGG